MAKAMKKANAVRMLMAAATPISLSVAMTFKKKKRKKRMNNLPEH